MAARGPDDLPLFREKRINDPARELKALGYDSLALDDLVMLRDHGMTADRIRSANARAGSRLPIDLLKSFAAGGGR